MQSMHGHGYETVLFFLIFSFCSFMLLLVPAVGRSIVRVSDGLGGLMSFM